MPRLSSYNIKCLMGSMWPIRRAATAQNTRCELLCTVYTDRLTSVIVVFMLRTEVTVD